MKVGSITEAQETFSYKNQRFSDRKFIICVRDDKNENYVKTIICFDNNKLIDLDEYEFVNNLLASKPPYNNPNNIEDLPLNRFQINELIKIDYASIVENTNAENDYDPKIKTYNANIHSVATNQTIEFFEGYINEGDSLFTPNSINIFELIKNVYVETEKCFFIILEGKLIGPFTALKVNDNSFKIAKSTFKKFGEYKFSENSFLEFEANQITRKIYIDANNLSLIFNKEYDFTSDNELIKEFEKELTNHPDSFNEISLENIKKIITKSSEIKSLEKIINDNSRLKKLLQESEKMLIRNIDLINLIPEVKKIKEEKKQIEEELFIYNQELDEISIKKKDLQNEITSLEETKTAELESRKNNLDKDICRLPQFRTVC